MNDELDNLTDSALSEVFALEIAGWINQGLAKNMPAFLHKWKTNNGNQFWDTRLEPLPFATSADAVLPFMMGKPFGVVHGVHKCPPNKVAVIIYTGSIQTDHQAISSAFARAACIALIKAKRAEKGANERYA